MASPSRETTSAHPEGVKAPAEAGPLPVVPRAWSAGKVAQTAGDLAFLLPIVGPRALLRAAVGRMRSSRSSFWYPVIRTRVQGRRGLEIGGPSPNFTRSGRVPVYELLASCDNVDYAYQTIWTGARAPPAEFAPQGVAIGRQLVQDGTLLLGVPDGRYEVVLSSHVLEHLANPLRALENWKRALTEPGCVLLVVPDGTRTFDHRRPVTPVPHMVSDLERVTAEDDLSHLPEVLARHDLRLDRIAGSREEFERRSRANLQYRALHHHVFSAESLRATLETTGLHVLLEARVGLSDLLVFAAKR